MRTAGVAKSVRNTRIKRKLRIKQSVPPNPETILEGLASLRFGKSTPSPRDSEVSPRLTMQIPATNRKMVGQGNCSRVPLMSMSVEVRMAMLPANKPSLIQKTRVSGNGASPTIQSRRPSRLKSGKMKRVQRVETARQETPKFKKLMRPTQKGSFGSAVKC